MNIHEYQARSLLAKFGVPVPAAELVTTPDEAAAAYEKLGTRVAVVKAQVHAGGRGKGGGVKLVKSANEARQVAEAILSKPLVTPQTPSGGVPVRQLLVAAGVDIEKEFYLGMAVDRAGACPVLIASSEGGVEIEQVARTNPQAIVRVRIDPRNGLYDYQARTVAFQLGFQGDAFKQFCTAMKCLTKLFLATDASLAEINPLVLTRDGKVLAIDAKINFDDNALYRQSEIAAMRDEREENPAEVRARKHELSYISLQGDIGCLVNGAGLAMATMDIIKLHGGEPANFLDVGGGATEEAVTEAFRIILSDGNVKGVLVNIFGGIAKCDTIASAIVNAAGEVGFKVPLVVRLEGTNVDKARQILEQAKASIPTMIVADDLTDAARKITAAVAA
ncbi:MAG: ADP-forming succinate--CoA ligase subunit beta [Phycisphaeraceae bacterium]|nr:ADP-forming succinate--CoA ligase subunit beta [Phycisphaeraceae bacterium]